MATQFSGGTYINTTFAGTYKCNIMQALLQNLCTNGTNAGWTNQAMSTGNSPGSWGLTMGPGNVSTVTLTIANPGVVNWTSHGFLGGERVMFQASVNTGGFLCSGIAVNTWYYVKYINANSFNVSNSYNGGNIQFTGSTGGTIWCYSAYLLLATATQPTVTNPAVIRIQDNGGTCINITIQNYAGTLIGNNGINQGSGSGRYYGGSLQPITYCNYQLIATRYQFTCFNRNKDLCRPSD